VKFGRDMDKVLVETNELRTRGTDALLAAACEASAGGHRLRRFPTWLARLLAGEAIVDVHRVAAKEGHIYEGQGRDRADR